MILRVESRGSIWELDLTLERYRRFPKEERPREMPEWSDERAGALQDFVWHPMVGRPTIEMDHWTGPRIFIPVPDERVSIDGKGKVVTAPLSGTEALRVDAALRLSL